MNGKYSQLYCSLNTAGESHAPATARLAAVQRRRAHDGAERRHGLHVMRVTAHSMSTVSDGLPSASASRHAPSERGPSHEASLPHPHRRPRRHRRNKRLACLGGVALKKGSVHDRPFSSSRRLLSIFVGPKANNSISVLNFSSSAWPSFSLVLAKMSK